MKFLTKVENVIAAGQAELFDTVALAIRAAAQPMFEANSQLRELDLYAWSAVSMPGIGRAFPVLRDKMDPWPCALSRV